MKTLRSVEEKSFASIFSLLVCLSITCDSSLSQEKKVTEIVRGKILSVLPDKRDIPAAHFKVTLHRTSEFEPPSKALKTTFTSQDGSFFFRNTSIGGYSIAVWNNSNNLIGKYEININDSPYHDIPPIHLKSAVWLENVKYKVTVSYNKESERIAEQVIEKLSSLGFRNNSWKMGGFWNFFTSAASRNPELKVKKNIVYCKTETENKAKYISKLIRSDMDGDIVITIDNNRVLENELWVVIAK